MVLVGVPVIAGVALHQRQLGRGEIARPVVDVFEHVATDKRRQAAGGPGDLRDPTEAIPLEGHVEGAVVADDAVGRERQRVSLAVGDRLELAGSGHGHRHAVLVGIGVGRGRELEVGAEEAGELAAAQNQNLAPVAGELAVDPRLRDEGRRQQEVERERIIRAAEVEADAPAPGHRQGDVVGLVGLEVWLAEPQ